MDIPSKLRKYIAIKKKISLFFSLLVILIYFSFILLIGFNPSILILSINNSSLTYGIIFGLSIICLSIILTLIYTLISNFYLDKMKDNS